MKHTCFFLITLSAIVFSSCSKLKNNPQPDALQSISLRDTLTMYTGNIVSLDIQVTPASYDTTAFVWGSSDTSVIAVTNKGKITAKNEGTSTISVSNAAKTKSISCIVTVKDKLKIGLLAYYPFNHNTADASGKGNDGAGNDLTPIANRFGVSNSAYYFNGSTSYIRVKDKPVLRLNATNFTLNTWIKMDSYSNTYGYNLLSKHISGADNGWAWGVTGFAADKLGVITYGPGGGSAFARGAIVMNVGQWHMVTTEYNVATQQITMYVDGVLDTITPGLPSPNSTIDVDLYIGRDSPEVPTSGYVVLGGLDDVRIYNRMLSVSDIHKLFLSAN